MKIKILLRVAVVSRATSSDRWVQSTPRCLRTSRQASVPEELIVGADETRVDDRRLVDSLPRRHA